MHHICLSELPYFTNYGLGHKTQKCYKSGAQYQDRPENAWMVSDPSPFLSQFLCSYWVQIVMQINIL